MIMNPLGKARRSILQNRLVQLIEKDHEDITSFFINDLLKNPDTTAYRAMDREKLFFVCDKIYRELSQWLSKDFDKGKIRDRYMKIARERIDIAIPFSQVQKALVLQKRHLWLYLADKLYDDKTAYMEALDLTNRVILYFDRATFYVLKAYEEMLNKKF